MSRNPQSVEEALLKYHLNCRLCNQQMKAVPDTSEPVKKFLLWPLEDGGYILGRPLKKLDLCYYHNKIREGLLKYTPAN